MHEYPDTELINLVCENNDDARDLIYDKYGYIVELVCNKYRTIANKLGIEHAELKQEAMVGFSDALVSFNQEKNASLPTFITICVERRVGNILKKAEAQKRQLFFGTYSLEHQYGEDMVPLIDTIADTTFDPQVKLATKEKIKEIKHTVEHALSPSERDVYELMINDYNYDDIAAILNMNPKQIYNTAQRIRSKLKKHL